MNMNGTIPDSLYGLTNLKILSLKENDFEGSIRPEIGNLRSLKELELHSNPHMTGTLPSELGLCHNLGELQLY
jgi:hypothetical protein